MNSGTPSDYRAVKNFRAELKRWGLRPRTIPVTVKKEKQTVTTHEIPKDTLVIMSQPPLDIASTGKRASGGGPSEVRGHLMAQLIPLMRKLDKPEGITTNELKPALLAAFPTLVAGSLSSTLNYHAKRGTLTKVGYSRYRLPELIDTKEMPANVAAAIPAPSLADTDVEEDIRKLDEALAALAQIDSIVRKHREIVTQMASLRALLGR